VTGDAAQLFVALANFAMAHVFDTFARQFTDGFREVGIARRGFGAYAGAPPPNNLDTLVADLIDR
jgi:hypothetical protein